MVVSYRLVVCLKSVLEINKFSLKIASRKFAMKYLDGAIAYEVDVVYDSRVKMG